jgi:uncharacterized phage protein gp47/JayE
MAFLKGFDELLNDLLTDYRNQFPEADTSQGSLIFIKSACTASALWGLYRYQEYISKQMFPDTADTENLEHHGWVRGVTRTYGETDAAYLARVLDYIRRPPAGGNKYDYIKWAGEIDSVAAAYVFPLAQGLGTVDVVILSNDPATGEIPGQPLLDAVKAHIDDVRPVTASAVRVLAPTVLTEGVTMAVTGANADKAQIAADITAYMATLIPGQTLFIPQLLSIAVQNGADNASVSIPAADVVPTSYQMIRPGVVSVS